MDIVKLSKIEAICLVIVATINQVILGAPKVILLGNGSGSLLNIIAITFLAIILILLISFLFKRFQSSDIIDVSAFLGGKILKTVVSILYIGIFFVINAICLRYISEFLKIIYFRDYSIIFISLFFLVAMVFASQRGLKAIAKINVLTIVTSFITIFILLIGSSPSFVAERALPVLGYGFDKTFFVNLSNIFAFSGILYLMLLMPYLENTKDFKQIGIISIVLSSVYLFISVLCLLLVFPFITIIKDIFSVFLLTRIVEYSPILERTDAIYVFFWLFCILSYLSANLFFIMNNFSKITNLKNPSGLSYCFTLLTLGITIFITEVSQYFFVYTSFFPCYFIILIIISILILVFANIKDRKKNRKE